MGGAWRPDFAVFRPECFLKWILEVLGRIGKVPCSLRLVYNKEELMAQAELAVGMF
jgi:hypothetical protein